MSRVSRVSKKVYRKCLCWFGAFTDRKYLDPNVPMPGQFDSMHYLTEIGNRKGIRILEIGSREVTARSESRRKKFSNAEYVGFDYYPGPNVDVVEGAHKLSQYFIHKTFDIIYSFAVFEHLAMPWVVATEISKLLKLGGLIFIQTHFSFYPMKGLGIFPSSVIWLYEYYFRQL